MSDYTRGLHELTGAPPGEPNFSPRTLAITLRRRWWVVLGLFVLVVAAAAFHTSRQIRIYRSSTTVRVQDQPSLASGAAFQNPTDWRVDRILSEQEVIRSQAVGERAAHALGLRLRIDEPARVLRSQVFGRRTMPVVDSAATEGRYEVALEESSYELLRNGATIATAAYGEPVTGPGFTFTIPARPNIDDDRLVLSIISLSEAGAGVRAGVTSRRIPETNVLEIFFTGPDPEYVKLTADAVTLAYEEFAKTDRRAKARHNTEFIRTSLDEQEEIVRTAQNSLRAFKESEQVADLGAEQASVIGVIGGLEERLNNLLIERNSYETIVGSLALADTATDELRRLAATQAVQEHDYLRTLYDRWFDLSRQRTEVMTKGRAEWHPEVIGIDEMIAKTKSDIRAVSGDYLRGLDSRIGSLRQQIAGLRQTLTRYPSLAAASAQLESEVSTQQSIFQELAEKYHNARIAEASEEGYVHPIDVAEWPQRPIAPRRKIVFLTAALLGLMLGIGGALAVERFDDTIKSPEEMREAFGLGLLGTIPGIKGLSSRRGQPGPGDRGRLVTHLDPRSPVAEAYRSLRTNLAFSRAHAPPKSIVFTSPGAADGKSTTVANLAITFAQQGQRTLLIDADLRRAVLDSLFGVPREPGLTDVLVGRTTVRDAAKPTEVDNLFVLGSGPFPSNPSELLGSTAMRDVLHDAMSAFDMVLLDSPPLLAVTDAAVLSTIADAAVLVVRTGQTTRAAARRATAQLQTVRGHLVGAVLNDVDVGSGLYYGGYGYYYYTYYGQDGNGANGQHEGVLGRLKQFVARTPSKH